MEICFWALTAIYHPTLKARNRKANGEWAFADAIVAAVIVPVAASGAAPEPIPVAVPGPAAAPAILSAPAFWDAPSVPASHGQRGHTRENGKPETTPPARAAASFQPEQPTFGALPVDCPV